MPRSQQRLTGTDPVARFAQRLRDARDRAGLTLRQLAAVAGYARSTLSAAESGTRLPAWAVTEAYVRACGHRDLSRWRGWWESAQEHEPPAAPQQLPADVRGFVGRHRELRLLDTAAPVVTISGPAGVGKTSLAVHWAHRRAERFPGGRLHVNLRGFSGGEPLAPEEALRSLLDGLGVAPKELPEGLDALAARYRSLVAGRRLLVVLDNAADTEQVRPLLSGSATVRTLITSRHRLTGLTVTDGAEPLALSALTAADGRAMLTARLPGDDLRAVDRVVRLCAGLPLALSVVVARARQSGHPLSALADALADDGRVLDPLTAGDDATDVRTVFSWSYAALGEAAARMFRLLALGADPDLSETAAAALAGLDRPGARRALSELVDASLVESPVPGRFALHDLLRAYARDLLVDDAERRAADQRLLDHYLSTALAADRLLRPSRDPLPMAVIVATTGPFADRAEAAAWLDAERRTLLAAVRHAAAAGFDAHAFQLVWALNTYQRQRGNWPEWIRTWHVARDAAQRLGESAALGMALRGLAHASTVTGRPQEALAGLADALELYRKAGDPLGEAQTCLQVCAVHSDHGDPGEALDHAQRALTLFDAAGHQRGSAAALNAAGWISGQLGRHREAAALCRQAVDQHRELGDEHEEALALDSLGLAHSRLGEHAEAVACYQRAIDLLRALGERVHEAGALDSLGEARAAAGDPQAARAAWREAFDLLSALEHPQAATMWAKLTSPVTTAPVGPL